MISVDDTHEHLLGDKQFVKGRGMSLPGADRWQSAIG